MLQRTGVSADDDGVEVDDEGSAGVGDAMQRVGDGDHLEGELLDQLPSNRVGGVLPLVELSARELPQTPVALVFGPASEEVASVALDHGGDHRNVRHWSPMATATAMDTQPSSTRAR